MIMRVLLADDEPKVRSALRLVLEQLKGVDAIEEAADAESLADCLRTTRPDLLLLDWELPGLHPGASYDDMLRLSSDHLKVIVLSGRYQSNRSALAFGADAFVSKCEPPERLFATLRALGAN
jgi:DNA-binding NarL/FixJ family response regulator